MEIAKFLSSGVGIKGQINVSLDVSVASEHTSEFCVLRHVL